MPEPVYLTPTARQRRKVLSRSLVGVVAMGVTAAVAIASTTSAVADENGFLDAGGLRVETSGADASGALGNQRVDVDLPELNVGLQIDFAEYFASGVAAPGEVVANIGEADFDRALGQARTLVNELTGWQLDESAELERALAELSRLDSAVDGYVAAPPPTPSVPIEMTDESLDLLALLDDSAVCRDRCLAQGAIRVIVLGALYAGIGLALKGTIEGDRFALGVDAGVVALTALTAIIQLVRVELNRLTPEQRAQMFTLGIGTALQNSLSLLIQAVGLRRDALGGVAGVQARAVEAANELIAHGGAGLPAGGAVAIDMRDEL